ncbi:hypothetical protein CASFOL_027405 [Castilleja foliolosa]|uniref:Uncharacterized protein n=1 Tax=Castilleja foliolosa TaxID=1961234 RepID=A0ABD3CGB0_9LAMI
MTVLTSAEMKMRRMISLIIYKRNDRNNGFDTLPAVMADEDI